MDNMDNGLGNIMELVASGRLSPEVAARRLQSSGIRYVDDGGSAIATLDTGRRLRKGVPEIIYSAGKSPRQVSAICSSILGLSEESGFTEKRVIVSKASEDVEMLLRADLPDTRITRCGHALVVGDGTPEPSGGRVCAMSAGTSDIPALDESIAVAEEMGVEVKRFNDVGVAGLHRLVEPMEQFEEFDPDVLIVAAGMEGALPTVLSSLVSVPVIGLPTSTGYGLGGDGTAAILGMLQSCSPGLSVVNVDNGVGAGATAALISNRTAKARAAARSSSR